MSRPSCQRAWELYQASRQQWVDAIFTAPHPLTGKNYGVKQPLSCQCLHRVRTLASNLANGPERLVERWCNRGRDYQNGNFNRAPKRERFGHCDRHPLSRPAQCNNGCWTASLLDTSHSARALPSTQAPQPSCLMEATCISIAFPRDFIKETATANLLAAHKLSSSASLRRPSF